MSQPSQDEVAKKILTTYRSFAVVGCSPDENRPSHGVAQFLIAHGYRVVPVNPAVGRCLDRTCYPDLRSIPAAERVEVVDIFRRADQAGVHVDEAIQAGARAIWMQLGVVDAEAAARARAAGLDVVMDRCPAIEYGRLLGASGPRR